MDKDLDVLERAFEDKPAKLIERKDSPLVASTTSAGSLVCALSGSKTSFAAVGADIQPIHDSLKRLATQTLSVHEQKEFSNIHPVALFSAKESAYKVFTQLGHRPAQLSDVYLTRQHYKDGLPMIEASYCGKTCFVAISMNYEFVLTWAYIRKTS